MPVYEYRCTSCEKEFEYQQRMSDPPKAVCEACGGALEKLISRTAFQFKGGGWYKDLYSSTKPGDAGKSEGGGGGGGESSSKSDSGSEASKSSSGSGSDSGSSATSSGASSGTGTGTGTGGTSASAGKGPA